MSVTERQIEIGVPVASVFAYLADFTRHNEWAAHDLRVEQTSDGPVGVGSTFSSVGHQLGRDNEDKVSVVEFVANEKIAYESQFEAGRVRNYFILKSEDGGTSLTKGVESLELRFPFSVLFPLLRVLGQVGSGLSGDLNRIKEKLEAGAPAPEQPAAEAPAPEQSTETPAEPFGEAEEKPPADQE